MTEQLTLSLLFETLNVILKSLEPWKVSMYRGNLKINLMEKRKCQGMRALSVRTFRDERNVQCLHCIHSYHCTFAEHVKRDVSAWD